VSGHKSYVEYLIYFLLSYFRFYYDTNDSCSAYSRR